MVPYIGRINRRPNMRELHPELQYFGSTAERFKKALRGTES